MKLSATHIFFIAVLTFFVGYWLQKSKVKKLSKKIQDAEDAAMRTDKDYLAILKENEALKERMSGNANEDAQLHSLQEILRKKKSS